MHTAFSGSLGSRGCTCSRQLHVACFSTIDDLYGILSVPVTANQAEIKAAYRRLVHDLHPDKHAHKLGHKQAAAADAFLKCKLAYEVLSDAEQRKQYDEALATAAAAGQPHAAQGQPQAPAWSPYNGWMDAYSSSGSSTDTQPGSHEGEHTAAGTADYYNVLQMAAAATAAAGASSSGLSHYKDPLAPSSSSDPGLAGLGDDPQQTPAAVRAALLQQHGLVMEQFGSWEDACAALAERDQQDVVVGLAEGDYDQSWQ